MEDSINLVANSPLNAEIEKLARLQRLGEMENERIRRAKKSAADAFDYWSHKRDQADERVDDYAFDVARHREGYKSAKKLRNFQRRMDSAEANIQEKALEYGWSIDPRRQEKFQEFHRQQIEAYIRLENKLADVVTEEWQNSDEYVELEIITLPDDPDNFYVVLIPESSYTEKQKAKLSAASVTPKKSILFSTESSKVETSYSDASLSTSKGGEVKMAAYVDRKTCDNWDTSTGLSISGCPLVLNGDAVMEGAIDKLSTDFLIDGLFYTAGTGFEAGFEAISPIVVKKVAKKAAGKFVLKYLTGVGLVLSIPIIGYTGYKIIVSSEDNKRCNQAAFGSKPFFDETIQENRPPSYYCGKLYANVAMALVGVTGSTATSSVIAKYLAKKAVIKQFGKAVTVRALESAAEGVMIKEVSKGTTKVIKGTLNDAEIIVENLVSNGWYLDNEITSIKTYLSPNGLEKINLRTISSSEQKLLEKGYTVNATLDLMPLNKIGGNAITNQISEIKFVTN